MSLVSYFRILLTAALVSGVALTAFEDAHPAGAAKPVGSADLSAYALGYGGVVLTEVPAAVPVKATGRGLRSEYGDGGRLVLLSKDGSTRVLTSDFDSAADPSVSMDGKRILFAAKKDRSDVWNIFEMSADGSGLRQITRGLGNCRKPMHQSALFYLNDARPSYQLTFVTDVDGEMNESGEGVATNLYSARFDGSGLRRLTYGVSASYDPFQMEDGRILFSNWQRSHLAYGPRGRIDLFAAHLDGTDSAAFSGSQGRRVKHMACVTAKRIVVFVESDAAPADGAGSLATLRLRRNLHSYRPITGAQDGLFYSPSPLPDGSILVSQRPAAGGGYAVYRMDLATGRRALVYRKAGVHAIQAVALAARPEPDGHSSVVEDDQNWSKLYGLNVYESDVKLPAGAARRIRLIEGIPAKTASASVRKRLLGDLELDDDGSFHVLVPPNTPIQIQIEDAEGMALRTSAWIWTKNKENRGCIGCHEDGERTPDNVFPKALAHAAADLMLAPERRRSVDYLHDVRPVLASKCSNGACHGGALKAVFPVSSYSELLARAPGPDRGRFVDPGRARTSRLVWAVYGRNTARPWDRMGAAAAPKKMPPAGAPQLSDDERRTIVEWIDLGAQLDAAPSKGPAGSGSGGQK